MAMIGRRSRLLISSTSSRKVAHWPCSSSTRILLLACWLVGSDDFPCLALHDAGDRHAGHAELLGERLELVTAPLVADVAGADLDDPLGGQLRHAVLLATERSEERRVGKEC